MLLVWSNSVERSVSYDVHNWNFDLLSRVGQPKGGFISELAPADPGKIAAIGFRQGSLLQDDLAGC